MHAFENEEKEEDQERKLLDRRDLIILQIAISECGDLACAVAFCNMDMDDVIYTCRNDEKFRKELENEIGKYHYHTRRRIRNLAMKSRKRYVWNENTQTNDVEYIPNEKMVTLEAQLHLAELKRVDSGEDAQRDFSAFLPKSANEKMEHNKDDGTVNYYSIDPELRKKLAKELIDAKRRNKT